MLYKKDCTTNIEFNFKKFQGDAGIDLCILEDVRLDAGCSTKLLSTGISVALPKDTVGLIWPRSSLAMQGIETGGGVIDESYLGEIKLILRNHSSKLIRLKAGARVAQLIIQPVVNVEPIQVDYLPQNNYKRETKGFGSTGK